MEEREKMMLEKIRPERHLAALITLASIKIIKECCRFYDARNVEWNPCYFYGADVNPTDWDEYDLTERMYK